MPCDVAGCCSLVRVVNLCFAVLYGQIQARTDQDHRLIPSLRTVGTTQGWITLIIAVLQLATAGGILGGNQLVGGGHPGWAAWTSQSVVGRRSGSVVVGGLPGVLGPAARKPYFI